MAAGKLSEPSDSERALEERVHYLVWKLEKTCKERDSLRSDFISVTERFEACRSAFELLLNELIEEGTTLKAKDKDKLRMSLRDLKDYEMYKNVMEATMMRMKVELSALMEENVNLRTSNMELRSTYTKHKNVDSRLSKNLQEYTKRVQDLEARNTNLIQENIKIQKDRDIAIAALVKVKTESKVSKD